jgi:hypothetical protein
VSEPAASPAFPPGKDAARAWLQRWLRGGAAQGIALALAAAAVYVAASRSIEPALADPRTANVWFDSDLPYRLEAIRHPGGWENGGAHPLFPTLGHLLYRAAALAQRGAEPIRTAGLAGAVAGGLFVLVLHSLFRRMGLPPLDAALFAAIGAASAGAVFWFPVPESFGLAGLGVAFALRVAAGAGPSTASLAAACAASASAILSNGLVGILAVLGHCGWRRLGRVVLCGLLALGGMAAVWTVQEWAHRTPFFLSHVLLEYEQHLYPLSGERTLQVVQGLLSHPVVAPALRPDRPSFRWVATFTSGPLGVVATLAWLVLLGHGTARTLALARRGERRPLALAAGGGLALMLAMHLSLGREMFLYALNLLPLLLALAAAGATAPKRRAIVRGVAVVLLLAGGLNNALVFGRAAESARSLARQRVAEGAAVATGATP